jgi:ribosome biogenesis GTPase
MYELANGGFIIDTPGLKSFATYDLEKEDLSHRFPEMRNLIGQCKFDNCQHISEPKCAVIQAVETGQIPTSRYENYLNIYQGDELEGFNN